MTFILLVSHDHFDFSTLGVYQEVRLANFTKVTQLTKIDELVCLLLTYSRWIEYWFRRQSSRLGQAFSGP